MYYPLGYAGGARGIGDALHLLGGDRYLLQRVATGHDLVQGVEETAIPRLRTSDDDGLQIGQVRQQSLQQGWIVLAHPALRGDHCFCLRVDQNVAQLVLPEQRVYRYLDTAHHPGQKHAKDRFWTGGQQGDDAVSLFDAQALQAGRQPVHLVEHLSARQPLVGKDDIVAVRTQAARQDQQSLGIEPP